MEVSYARRYYVSWVEADITRLGRLPSTDPENLRKSVSKNQFLDNPFCFVGQHPSLLTPAFFRKNIMGHQLVKQDWNRLSPTKAVNQSQFLE